MKLNEEAKARAQVWNHAFGYIKTSAVKSAIELQIPDVIDTHVGPISLSDLSSAVGCPPQLLHRLMRFLIHHGIFKTIDASASLHYAQTPLSHLMTRENAGPFVLLQGSPGVPSTLSSVVLRHYPPPCSAAPETQVRKVSASHPRCRRGYPIRSDQISGNRTSPLLNTRSFAATNSSNTNTTTERLRKFEERERSNMSTSSRLPFVGIGLHA